MATATSTRRAKRSRTRDRIAQRREGRVGQGLVHRLDFAFELLEQVRWPAASSLSSV